MARDRYEAGDSVQFTWQSSVAPDAAPSFAIYTSSGSLVNCMTAIQSAATAYFAMMTMPGSVDAVYLAEWAAAKTVSGTEYPFIKKFLFNVHTTKTQES